MAFVYPRDMTTAYQWVRGTPRIIDRQTTSRTPTRTIVAQSAPSIWSCSFETAAMHKTEADAYHSELQAHGGALRPMFVGVPHRSSPIGMDSPPETCTVHNIKGDRTGLALAGLPVGNTVTAGDFLSIVTAAGYHRLYRVAETTSVNLSGNTFIMTVAPSVDAQVQVGDVARIVNPVYKARMVPDSLDLSPLSGDQWSVSFDVEQDLS